VKHRDTISEWKLDEWCIEFSGDRGEESKKYVMDAVLDLCKFRGILYVKCADGQKKLVADRLKGK
jgi:hypothetical protein